MRRIDFLERLAALAFVRSAPAAVPGARAGVGTPPPTLLDFVQKKSVAVEDVRRGKVDASDTFDRWAEYLFGTLPSQRHGIEGATDNPLGIIPNGHYRISRAHDFSWTHGFRTSGTAMQGVTIEQTTPDTPHLLLDGASYFDLEHLTLLAGAPNGGPQLVIDWTGKYSKALKPQQSVIRRVATVGARYGIQICPSGGGAQGDTIHIQDCYGERCGFGGQGAAVAIGSPGNNAMNALGIRITGGCFQSCFPDAIANWGGQPIVDGTSFQNQGPWGAAPRQLVEAGADLHSYSCTASWPRAFNVRSESPVLAIGFKILEHCESYAASFNPWQPNTAVGKGEVRVGTPGPTNPNWDGRAYQCVQAGTTGATEPAWNGGTVTDSTAVWQLYDFYAVQGVAEWYDNKVSLGRVSASVGEGARFIGGRVTRRDWLDEKPFQGNPEAYNSFVDGVGIAQGAVTAPLIPGEAGWSSRNAWDAAAGTFRRLTI
jgi:hypothetical protein